jgi:transglutaminase-like putative cysteine protease
MLIHVGYDISFQFPQPTALVAQLSLHPSRMPSVRKPENLVVSPAISRSQYHDSFGNFCTRVMVPAGLVLFHNDCLVEDSGLPDPQMWSAQQHNVQDLPDDTLVFLLASRYCEVDSELREVAMNLFGGTAPGWSRVVAICGWVHQHIKFDYMQARANRTALEAYRERKGVCRDYMHLAVTFCRIMNIPARYCTGYLGDIGVPLVPPMDFSAWFEVYLGGQWWAFDARNNMPRIGRVLMARGRDAADVALTTTFGPNTLVRFDIICDEVPVAQEKAVLAAAAKESPLMLQTQT